MKFRLQRFVYYFFCAICLYLAFQRAAEMYITVDEAITYTDHIRPRVSGVLDFTAANNHFLNTVLAKFSSIFAPYSELSIRLPSLLVGAWFFLYFIPMRLDNWPKRTIFASLCLFPYYISEYWSMSRGYFMSACFAAAALIEVGRFLSSATRGSSLRSSRILGGLTVLSSFVMLPFSMVIGLTTLFGNKAAFAIAKPSSILKSRSAWFLFACCLLAAAGIYTFKTSGEALAYTPEFSILKPIRAVAETKVTGNIYVSLGYQIMVISACILAFFKRNLKAIWVSSIVALSLIVIWVGGATGTGYPYGRSWIPYWFCFSLIIVEGFSVLWAHQREKLEGTLAIFLASIALVNTIYWYTPEYSYFWRSNFYQVKALMYYSSLGKPFCLEEAYKGDKVLIFYWDDPKSAVKQPRTCNADEKSPYGFTNFEVPGEIFGIPRKEWGMYK